VSLYGMHITATAPASVNLNAAADVLLQQGVRIHTLNRYFMGPQTRHGLIFGYGSTDVAQIRRGLALLLKALP
jgi:GntR family transcriptional regulator/MocR family aminotransferase